MQYLIKLGYLDNTVFVHSHMSISDRIADLNQFQEDRQLSFLVGTTSIIGTGINCTAASQLVLMEPDNIRRNEDQAYARIRRFGQNNSKTFTFRLLCRDALAETRLLKRRAHREKFQQESLQAPSVPQQAAEPEYIVIE